MEFLKELLGEHYEDFLRLVTQHNENPDNKEKQIKLANLSNGDYVSKAKFDSLDAENKISIKNLDEANKLIEQMKKDSKDNEGLQGKITEYQQKAETLEKELQTQKLESAIKIGLLSEDALDIDYLSYKLREKGDELKIDDQGHIDGWEEKAKELKTQFPTMFKSKANGGFEGFKPGGNDEEHDAEPTSLAEALEMQFQGK